MTKRLFLLSVFILMVGFYTYAAESVSRLRSNYGTAKTTWSGGILTFSASGTINFDKANHKGFIWEVPTEVKKIVIKKNVTVNGAFHIFGDCIIEGEDRYSSVIFGTEEQRWADNRNLDEWYYCQIQVFGGTTHIKNLTILNPRSYAVRGWGKVIHMSYCDVIDTRGGWGNHSDGFSGGHGSTVDNCYFETGDDVIKIYFDITVTNTIIKMVQNSVPFQFGWGSYGDCDAVIDNVTILGDWGRGSECPIFNWKSGSNVKNVKVTNCNFQNPKSSLFQFESGASGATVNIDISSSYIDVKQYGTQLHSGGTRTVCGTTQKKGFYDCSGPVVSPTPTPDPTPAPTPTPVGPFSLIQAENFSVQSGGLETSDYCEPHLGQIDGGEWTAYYNIPFTSPAGSVSARVTSGGTGGSIEIRTSSSNGTLAGTIHVLPTGGWCNYTDVTAPVNIPAGTHDIYLVFKGGADIFDLDSFIFSKETTPDVTLGDTNGDGTVNILDALISAQYSAGLNPPGFNQAAGDVNCDSAIDILDALIISRYSVGLVSSLGC